MSSSFLGRLRAISTKILLGYALVGGIPVVGSAFGFLLIRYVLTTERQAAELAQAERLVLAAHVAVARATSDSGDHRVTDRAESTVFAAAKAAVPPPAVAGEWSTWLEAGLRWDRAHTALDQAEAAGEGDAKASEARFHEEFLAATNEQDRTAAALLEKIRAGQGVFSAQLNRAGQMMGLGAAMGAVSSVAIIAVLGYFVVLPATRRLRELGQSLATSANRTTEVATMVSRASQTLADGVSKQAASLEESSASIEEITSVARSNLTRTSQGAQASAEARQVAEHSGTQLHDMGRTLGSIQEAVGEMETAVRDMQNSSRDIASILQTIDEIAFQTNILALNAAVEAARAGAAGKGFAVVADEVRSLAQRSAKAAQETAAKIQTAMERTEHGGRVTAKVVKTLAEVQSTARDVEKSIAQVVARVAALDSTVSEVSVSSGEQSRGLTEVSSAVTQIDQVTQANAAQAEECAGAATLLHEEAGALQRSVGELRQLVEGLDPAQASGATGKGTPGAAPANPKAARPATKKSPPLVLRPPVRGTRPAATGLAGTTAKGGSTPGEASSGAADLDGFAEF